MKSLEEELGISREQILALLGQQARLAKEEEEKLMVALLAALEALPRIAVALETLVAGK